MNASSLSVPGQVSAENLALLFTAADFPTPIDECRLLTVSDLPQLLFLERYCFNPVIAFGRRRWRYLLNHPHGRCVGVFHQEQLIGYFCLLPHRGWQGVELRTLGVHWRFRQQGVGRFLIHQIKTICQDWHYSNLFLSVDCQNIPALNLYRYLGIELRRYQQPDYYGLDYHAYRLRYDVSLPFELIPSASILAGS